MRLGSIKPVYNHFESNRTYHHFRADTAVGKDAVGLRPTHRRLLPH